MKKTILVLMTIILTFTMLTAMGGEKERCEKRFPQPEHQMNPGKNPDKHFDKMGDHFYKLFQKLDLTEYQQEELENLRAEHQKASIQRIAEIDILEIDKKSALKDHDFKMAKKVTSDIFLIKQELALARIDHKENIWNLLDADQQVKFEDLLKEKPEFKEKQHCPQK